MVQNRPGNVPRFKRYLDDERGIPLDDVWTDITKVSGNEDKGYDTQKPRVLIERVTDASSEPDDLILDPFCRMCDDDGSGTQTGATMDRHRH